MMLELNHLLKQKKGLPPERLMPLSATNIEIANYYIANVEMI